MEYSHWTEEYEKLKAVVTELCSRSRDQIVPGDFGSRQCEAILGPRNSSAAVPRFRVHTSIRFEQVANRPKLNAKLRVVPCPRDIQKENHTVSSRNCSPEKRAAEVSRSESRRLAVAQRAQRELFVLYPKLTSLSPLTHSLARSRTQSVSQFLDSSDEIGTSGRKMVLGKRKLGKAFNE